MKTREIAGVKVFVSNEAYDEYKGTLHEQIKKLQSNWNSLREWLESRTNNFQEDVCTPILHEQIVCSLILDKMNELESGDNK